MASEGPGAPGDRLLRLLRAAEAPEAERLAEYGALVLKANERINLTGAKSPEAMAEHILDSMTLLPYVASALVDVGSGGGLPAIPLAIATGIPVTMIESVGKKAAFLREAVTALGISAEVLNERAEVAARLPRLRESFACGTARAVAGATTPAELLLPFIGVSGCGLLQRGRTTPGEREALIDAGLMLGANIERIILLREGHEIVVMRKTAATPQRFPRRVGIPAKRPLCVSRETSGAR